MRWFLWVVLVLTACSGRDDQCSGFNGEYRINYQEVSGDCGPMSSGESFYTRGLGEPDWDVCRGLSVTSPDGCFLDRDIRCQVESDGRILRLDVVLSVDYEASSAEMSTWLFDEGDMLLCKSDYAVTYTKIGR